MSTQRYTPKFKEEVVRQVVERATPYPRLRPGWLCPPLLMLWATRSSSRTLFPSPSPSTRLMVVRMRA